MMTPILLKEHVCESGTNAGSECYRKENMDFRGELIIFKNMDHNRGVRQCAYDRKIYVKVNLFV